ncbi:MAG: hypothetical protein RLZZ490_2192 [Cyanobacteriota bacterium]|jgi:hypothetical protein
MHHDSESGQHWASASVEKASATAPNWEAELAQLPTDWALTPVKEKRPLRPNWQYEPPLERPELLQLLQKGQPLTSSKDKTWHCHWTGIGLRLGKISGGLLAIDADGPLAETKLQTLSQGHLPSTPCWTSGKTGRRQLIYRIPSSNHDNLKTVKLDCGGGQYLEFRWDGCQSVLPPSRHPDTGQYYWLVSPNQCEVADAPAWLLMFLAKQNQPRPITVAKPYQPSLGNYSPQRSEIEWAQCYLAALSSYRADDYDQWLKVGMALHSVSDSLLGDWEAWSQQSSKYQEGDCERKWHSFKPEGTISIGSLYYWAKEDGWRSPNKESPPNLWQSDPSSQNFSSILPPASQSSSVLSSLSSSQATTTRKKRTMNFADLKHALLTAITYDYQGLLRTELELQLAHDSGLGQRQIKSLWRQIEQEQEFQHDCAVSLQDPLTKLLKTRVERLDPHRLFNPSLAQNIIDCANAMPGPAEGIVVTMLAAAAGCVGTHAEVVVKRSAGYTQPCLLRTLLVADSGQLKSPLQKVALAPLQRLEQESLEKHRQKMQAHKAEVAQLKKGEEMPDAPKRQRLLLVDATPEKVVKIHAESKQGFLMYRDEWGGYIKSFNKYRNGVGDDRELDLSEFNGSALIRDRVGDESIFIAKSAISRTGGVQPEVLTELANKGQDADGFFARWLVSNPPYPSPYKTILDDDGNQTEELQTQLYTMYRSLRALPERQYELERSAKQHFQTWQHHLVDLSLAEKQRHLKALYPKLEAYTARLALVLHLINAASEGQPPAATISGETMLKAIYLAQYFLGQYQWVFAQHSTLGDGLAGMLSQIHTFAVRCNREITAREVKQMVASVKKDAKATAGVIRTLFTKLASAGYGVTEGEGIHLKYKAIPVGGQQNPHSFSPPPDPLPHLDFSPSPPINNARLQTSTSTFVEPAVAFVQAESLEEAQSQKSSEAEAKVDEPQIVVVQLSDSETVQGQGRERDNGELEVVFDNGMRLIIPAHQRPQTQGKVDVDPGVDPIVAPPEKGVEPNQNQPYTEKVDLLNSVTELTKETVVDPPMDESIPWHTFPVAEIEELIDVDEANLQVIALEVKQELLRCENLHHFTVLVADFGEAIVQWVIDTFFPNQDFSFPNLKTI